jgi:homoserine O-succinyltransferase
MPLKTLYRSDVASHRVPRGTLRLGLVNNMPDSALEATETQFMRLLAAASATHAVELRLYHLPAIPRGEAARNRLERLYWSTQALPDHRPDALIVTGMEPGAGALTQEPYWESFVGLVEWADRNTVSSVWSCLAAHAALQHLHGVARRRRAEKLSGVYSHDLQPGHALLAGVRAPFRLPHSRWNDLPIEALRAAGCTILSSSSTTGADTFIVQRHSLFVCFQGHPEYEAISLLKEYRRDVGRFLRGQLAHYPSEPADYFAPAATRALQLFRERALASPSEALLGEFPPIDADAVRNTWQEPAAQIYGNWLALVAAARHNDLPASAGARSAGGSGP